TKKAIERCPTNAIQWLEVNQFTEQTDEQERYTQLNR
ncbi:MAG: Fe-S cluster protein, partial [Gammaproteobacteria bacterium]